MSVGTKTTLDDLMETLKKLEEEDHLVKVSGRKEKNEKPLEWCKWSSWII